MNINNSLDIVDVSTGEILDITRAKKEQMKKYVLSLSDKLKSNLLSKVNLHRRVAGALEKEIKGYVKGLELDFSDKVAMWEDFKVTKVSSGRFDKKKLLAEGTREEIEFYNNIKGKYRTVTETLKI